MKKFPAFSCLVLVLFAASMAWGWPGAFVLKAGSPCWGQYKNLSGIVAVPPEPGKDLADSIREYPLSGVSAVLLAAQAPGDPFFASDGASIAADGQKRMQHDLDVVNGLDMLPIVVLFDPACKPSGAAAYETAAVTFLKTFKKENWFLLCVTDQCDNAAFGDGIRLAQSVAAAVRKEDAAQVVAAGAGSPDANKQLLADRFIQMIVARAKTAGAATAGIDAPCVEVFDAGALSASALHDAADTAFSNPRRGFALADGAQVAAMLPKIFDEVDAYQKAHYIAMPPNPSDTFSLKPGEKEEGFVSLFNGKDMSGWVQITKPGEFVVEDGTIKMVGRSSGWARSWKTYKDFVFRGEFRIVDQGNNGFWFRTAPVGRNSRTGFEVQIFGDPAAMTPTKESCGAIYDVRPPDAHLMKPGDWNEYEVTCKGDEITIKWNGQVVHHVSYSDLEPMKDRARSGFIGLTQHHQVVEYRNLRVKEL